MVGYSARLATSTTFTSLLFSGCAHVPDWRLSLIVAMPCLLWSGFRLARTRRRWQDPVLAGPRGRHRRRLRLRPVGGGGGFITVCRPTRSSHGEFIVGSDVPADIP